MLMAATSSDGSQKRTGVPPANRASRLAAMSAPGLAYPGSRQLPNPSWMMNPKEQSSTSVFEDAPAAARFTAARIE